MGSVEPSDSDLVHASRAGDARALAALLVRHRAAMHAVAVARLGPGPQVEDVVQDANLVAITSLDRLRDPQRVRSWLTGITRNLCREQTRATAELPIDLSLVPDPAAAPEERLERNAVRDWVWSALDALSEPLHRAVVLRYFSDANSYAAIAAALGIPVGTVRSRLNEAHRVLAKDLDELARSSHREHHELELRRAGLMGDIFAQYNQGIELDLFRSVLSADARLTADGSDDVFVGPEKIVRSLGGEMAAGVRMRLLNVIAGKRITIIEGAFENPPDDPSHCPPLTTQIMTHDGDRIAAIHLHYSTT